MDDPGTERDVLSPEPLRIAGAVEALVMVADRGNGVAEEAKAGDSDSKSGASGGVGGLLGGFAKKMAAKKMGGDDANTQRATVMTMNNQVLKVVTDVTADDVAVKAGLNRDG